MVKIPTKLEELLPPAALGKILDVLNQPSLSGAVRDALNRVGIKDASPVEQVQEAWQQAREWVGQVASRILHPAQSNPQLINATGELARADWSGFPMSPSVAEAIGVQAVSFHHAARCEDAAEQAAVAATGASSALFTSSLPAAFELIRGAFNSIAISRADTVRVPCFGDVGAMLPLGHPNVLEIGATNGASEEDWARAVTGSDQAIVLVSPNSLSKADAHSQREAAIKVSRATGAALIELLIDGVCGAAAISPESDNTESANAVGQTSLAFPHVAKHLQTGASAVVFPLDGLLGGPAGACIACSASLSGLNRSKAASRGLQLRGAALAGVAVAFERAMSATPIDTGVTDLLHVPIANLKDRARRLAIQIADSQHVTTAESVERIVPLGPSPWNRYQLPSVALALTPRKDAHSLQALLQSGERGPAILCNVVGERVLIDLRFVVPRDDHQIVLALGFVEANPQSDAVSSPPNPPASSPSSAA